VLIPGVKFRTDCFVAHQETSSILSGSIDVTVVGPTGGVIIGTKVNIPISQGGWIEGLE